MSAIDVARILEPVALEQPCGTDLEYDAEFLALVQAATPTPERQMGAEVVAAEEPNWRDVKRLAIALLRRSKDLRLVMPLCQALVHTDGIGGLVAGLQVVRGLIETQWAKLFPLLDVDDDNDATMRVNALLALVDAGAMLRSLRECPLVTTRVAGSFSLRDIDAAAGRIPVSNNTASSELIRAAFQEVDSSILEATLANVRQANVELDSIESSLGQLLGGMAPDLRPMANVLHSQARELEQQLIARGSTVTTSAGGPAANAGTATQMNPTAGSATAPSGGIQSRSDVLHWIDRICEFYAANEPSSPVPVLMQRAKRLVSKSFLDVVRDLVPDGLNQAMVFHGQQEES